MLVQVSQQSCFIQVSAAKNKSPFLKQALSILLIFTAIGQQLRAQDVVDATTMSNKILAGYQGWFRVPGDRPGSKSWAHVFNGSNLVPEKLALDTWPDMSQYDADEKTVVPGFTNPDGSPATMYSAQNPKTVLRHFQWMKDYGIDGVWLSEFCGSFRNGKPDSAMYTIMKNVQAAATKTGRTWAFMWDMSSFGPTTSKEMVYNTIVEYWKKMVDDGIATDPRYMHQDGKPVLLIWGFFPDRPASQPDHMTPVVDFLLTPGKYQATLIAGADNKWRKGTPEFIAMLMRMQGLQPWSVGRRVVDHNTGYQVEYMDEWADDMAMCKAHGVVFQPVINAGTHKAGPPPTPPALPAVPRRMGNYLWEQFINASKTGVINSAFIAMFDEVNEGTQINKITNKPPVQAPFLTYDGATNDYYLRLIGTASKMLKNNVPFTSTIPISPFDEKKIYTIKNKASGLVLHSKGKLVKSPIVQAAGKGIEWQLVYDGNGFFTIKNKLSGMVLSAGADNIHVTQVANSKSDNAKWHLEWDATGACRIINKAVPITLSSNNSTIANPAITLVTAPAKPDDLKTRDDLRWQVIEQ
ncbi:RICIN domain-containing protein [Mucilaginibacter sp.]|uniref:RICIN domain-containing protein n=1 Tax=Mucilaginibacter sp. TaxID=1882438 RepID=UPI002631912F|nr:RICIN domain-containing protein [Mucilaginibacter sp.]MDB4925044.1 Ricin-type beta-trefoil lectin domain-like [Mucilaginibacter sp.]